MGILLNKQIYVCVNLFFRVSFLIWWKIFHRWRVFLMQREVVVIYGEVILRRSVVTLNGLVNLNIGSKSSVWVLCSATQGLEVLCPLCVLGLCVLGGVCGHLVWSIIGEVPLFTLVRGGKIHSPSHISLWMICCGKLGSHSPLLTEFTEHRGHKLGTMVRQDVIRYAPSCNDVLP